MAPLRLRDLHPGQVGGELVGPAPDGGGVLVPGGLLELGTNLGNGVEAVGRAGALHAVAEAADQRVVGPAQRGVEQFTVGDYDLVLMDMQMPVMDGAAATRAIRAWERAHHRPPTPVLALTANVLAADVQACLDAGCTSHIAKPVKKPVLLEAIARHAARCSSSESLAASQTARSTAA